MTEYAPPKARYYARPDYEAEPGPVLWGIIRNIRAGDALVTPNVSHLAFSLRDLRKVLRALEAKAASLRPEYVSGNSSEPLAARYKRDLKRAAVERAKVRGAYANCKGRAPVIDRAEVRRLKAEGLSPDEIGKRLGCARSSVYYTPRQQAA